MPICIGLPSPEVSSGLGLKVLAFWSHGWFLWQPAPSSQSHHLSTDSGLVERGLQMTLPSPLPLRNSKNFRSSVLRSGWRPSISYYVTVSHHPISHQQYLLLSSFFFFPISSPPSSPTHLCPVSTFPTMPTWYIAWSRTSSPSVWEIFCSVWASMSYSNIDKLENILRGGCPIKHKMGNHFILGMI